jgi:type IV pilus assembly protein PilQ
MRAPLAAAICGTTIWTAAGTPAAVNAEERAAMTDLCPRGKIYRGTPLDLDVKDADLRDLFRLLADVGRVSIVLGSDVDGKATLRLRAVPWDQILCTVAAAHRLEVEIDGNVVMVRRRAPAK